MARVLLTVEQDRDEYQYEMGEKVEQILWDGKQAVSLTGCPLTVWRRDTTEKYCRRAMFSEFHTKTMDSQ